MKIIIQKISALVLLLAFTVQSFSQGILLLDFYIRRAYITKTECINRYRPMLHCNGQCALARKLKAQEKKEQQHPDLKAELKQEVLSSRHFVQVPVRPERIINFVFTDYISLLPQEYTAAIFHPPGC